MLHIKRAQRPSHSPLEGSLCLSEESHEVVLWLSAGSCLRSRCHCPAGRSYSHSSPSVRGSASALPPMPTDPEDTKHLVNISNLATTILSWTVKQNGENKWSCYFCEGRCGHLYTAFIRGVYLQIVSVRAVQTQKTTARKTSIIAYDRQKNILTHLYCMSKINKRINKRKPCI